MSVRHANSFFISSIVFSIVISFLFSSVLVKLILTLFVILKLINALWTDHKNKLK